MIKTANNSRFLYYLKLWYDKITVDYKEVFMKPLQVNTQYIDEKYLNDLKEVERLIKKAHTKLKDKSGEGNDFLGWYDLPNQIDDKLLKRIQNTAERLQQYDVLLVIGIGGSYLGAKAVIEGLKGYFTKSACEIIFVGHQLSSTYMVELKEYLADKTFAINVISKSGTTTEPAIAFRIFKQLLEEQVGKDEAKKRIVATTDAAKGALRTLADNEGYETYDIADDIGGRYSVLTPVGLLPIAVANQDIISFLKGMKDAYQAYNVEMQPEVYDYVKHRHLLYRNGKKIEIFVHYEPALYYTAEWWKQLFGESEGKDGKGLFVASLGFTTDLHSMGQYIQDGERHLFETVVQIEEPLKDLEVEDDEQNLDGLNYLKGLTVNTVNTQAMLGTLLAHSDGDAPSMVIKLRKLDAYHLGYLMYFYELSCAISGYVLGVNPFNQPGVEDYKKNMFALLEKPGYEAMTKALKKRLK